MTPTEHLREAERLVRLTEECSSNSVKEWGALNLAAAQVHATLALVGATILGSLLGYDTARHELGDAVTETKQ